MLCYGKFNILYLTFLLSEVEARATISIGDEVSSEDSSRKVFSPKCKDNSSNLYAGFMVKSHKTVIRNLSLISGGALSHLMRKNGVKLDCYIFYIQAINELVLVDCLFIYCSYSTNNFHIHRRIK